MDKEFEEKSLDELEYENEELLLSDIDATSYEYSAFMESEYQDLLTSIVRSLKK